MCPNNRHPQAPPGRTGPPIRSPSTNRPPPRPLHNDAERPRGGGRDCVGVHVDPPKPQRGDRAGDLDGGVRRADAQHQVAPGDQRGQRTRIGQVRGLRATPGGGPTTSRDPEHLDPGPAHGGTDRGAHLTRMQQPNSAHRPRILRPGPPACRCGCCTRATRCWRPHHRGARVRQHHRRRKYPPRFGQVCRGDEGDHGWNPDCHRGFVDAEPTISVTGQMRSRRPNGVG
jgi:hypothetical protein